MEQHAGSLFNILRSFASIQHDALEQAKTLYQGYVNDEDSALDQDIFYQLPSASSTIDSQACVVPVTAMFVDLRGFTALVESCPPNQVIRQLNEYFSSMTRIIVEYGGILDKYMGDEIMAYFESQNPLEYGKAAYQAVCAGIEMQLTLEKLNERWKERGWPELNCGIGINSGPALKGNIGSMIKMETTIIGDTVNVASRLQQLNKQYNSKVLLSGTTQQLIEGEFPVRSLGNIQIRGKKLPVNVYEIMMEALPLHTPDDTSEPQHKIS